jgi:hypothetical protein
MDIEIRLVMIRLTAVGMVLCWLVRLVDDLNRRSRTSERADNARLFVLPSWGIGYLLYLLHIVVAFAGWHDWSHDAAYEHTAARTAAVTDWAWGGGLWINYALALWWPLDWLWCWRRGMDHIPRWYRIAMHTTLGFIVINATIVFGPPWWRWFLPLLVLLLVGVFWRRGRTV